MCEAWCTKCLMQKLGRAMYGRLLIERHTITGPICYNMHFHKISNWVNIRLFNIDLYYLITVMSLLALSYINDECSEV